jgi:signal transduction histidine kinase
MAEKTLKRSQVFGNFLAPLLRLPQMAKFLRFWLWLLGPASTLDFADLQYARLTLGLLLVCFLTSFVSLAYQAYLNQGGQFYASIASLAISFIYLLARSKHYRWAAWIFSLLPYAILSLSFLEAAPRDIVTVLYTCIGFFIASLVLKPKDFVPYCLLILLWYSLVFTRYFETLQLLEQLQVLIFGMVMLSLVLVTSFMRYSQLQQIDEQLRLLEEIASLAQKSLVDAEAARREAEKANLIKSAFLASISHELRTPLNAIINFSQLLRVGRFGALNNEQGTFLERVVSNGKHLLGLINDVLDISKIAAGSLSLYLEANTDLQELLAEIPSTVEALLQDKSVQFCMDIRPIPLLMADRQRVYQIILNLLSNACKFTEAGQIDLRLDYLASSQEICIEVADTGSGIADEEQDKVFRAFEQAASGLRLGAGTGLGMPISRALAEAHGGKLFFESRLGQGTTFTCILPLRPPEAVVQRYYLADKTE